MSLQTRLDALITAIGADIKSLQSQINALPGGGGTTPRETTIAKTQGWVIARPSSTAADQTGLVAPVATGTATAANRAITNYHTRARRLDFLVTTAATTAVAGWRDGSNYLVRGNAAGIGGFYTKWVWGPSTGVSISTHRAFVGLSTNTASPTDVQPSSLTNMIGMGWDSADTNIQLMYNGGSGTATKVDLGSGFPVPNTDRTNMYQLELWCDPNDSEYSWIVTNLTTGASVNGSTGTSTTVPSNSVYLSARGWMSVGGTSSVIGIALSGYYYESPPN